MKLMMKLIIFLVLLLIVGPYLLMGPDGMAKFMAVTEKLIPKLMASSPSHKDSSEDLEALKKNGELSIQWSKESQAYGPERLTQEQLALLGDIPAQDNIYYRWQDTNGVWQFSQQPNPNTLNLIVRTDPEANLLQSLSADQIDIALGRIKPETSNSIVKNNPFANGADMEGNLPLPATIPLEEIPKLIEQAKDVQNIVDQRKQAMDQILSR